MVSVQGLDVEVYGLGFRGTYVVETRVSVAGVHCAICLKELGTW